MRSPSGLAVGRMRGLAPTETTSVSASISSKSVRFLPVPVDTTMPVRPVEPPVADDDAHARLRELRLQVLGLLAGQQQQALVDGLQVDGDLGAHRAAGVVAREELHAELAGLADGGRRLGRRDEGLRRHDVGQHRGAADADPLDERDVGAELGAREGGLIAAGTAAEHREPMGAFELVGHATILRASGWSSAAAGRCIETLAAK